MCPAGWQTGGVAPPVLLAADPAAFANVWSSLLAIAVFVILLFLLAPTFGGHDGAGDDATPAERRQRAEDVDSGTQLDAAGPNATGDRDRRDAPTPQAGP